jgi:CSLREA domain-containing protein
VASAATFVVNTVDDLTMGSCDALHCSLREAIIDSNASPGADVIAFNIPILPPPYSIKPITPLPPATGPVTIDGTTEPDYAGSPIVELDGSLAGPGPGVSGITLDGGNSVVRGLVINRFGPAANQQGGGIHIRLGGNNVVEHNYIGTDVTGTLPLGNSSGVWIGGSGGNRVGGTTAFARNIIADNKAGNGAGIWTVNPNNVIQGNYIGTDVTGTMPLPNGFGLVITGSNNLIGGTSPGARNVISGNRDAALEICANCGAFPTTGNVVQGNYIGTNASGTAAVPNIDNFGGAVLVRAPGNTIGGTAPGAGNLISGNSGAGVVIGFLFGNVPPATDNVVAGNLIGTLADGVTPLGNTGHGIHIGFFSPGLRNTIGGLSASAANTIAFNRGAGVFVETNSNQNAILSNSIHSNAQLGIDLAPPGLTLNDPGDADTGANELQNFPVITSASSSGGTTTVNGTLNSQPNTTYRLQFFANAACDPLLFGEGQEHLADRLVTTDATGTATFSFSFGSGSAGNVITATATDPLNNTSEFSACLTAPVGPGPPATLLLEPPADENPVGTEHCVTATVRDALGNPTPNISVRFAVTGANAASGSDTTDANGQAEFCYTGQNVGGDTIRAFADTNGNQTEDLGEPFGVATKTWTPAAPATLVLDPKLATNPTGTQHCVTATVRDAFGNPVPGVSVRFQVTGAHTLSGSVTTDANGQARFCYSGTQAGEDAIRAFADSDGDGTEDVGEPADTATKTWTSTCPRGDDDRDDDGLDDDRESLFGALLNDPDSDDDGIKDGNEDSDDDGEDDEDEDDEDDPCPDDDDGDGEDDEDEDDEEDDD